LVDWRSVEVSISVSGVGVSEMLLVVVDPSVLREVENEWKGGGVRKEGDGEGRDGTGSSVLAYLYLRKAIELLSSSHVLLMARTVSLRLSSRFSASWSL
jgi:hypothetical protein